MILPVKTLRNENDRDSHGRFKPGYKMTEERRLHQCTIRTGQGHPNWKGGRNIQSGYVMIWVGKGMGTHGNRGYIPEHILIAQKALGRKLKRGEVVHHVNGDKVDNRNRNLLICDKQYHQWLHIEMSRKYMEEHFRSIQ